VRENRLGRASLPLSTHRRNGTAGHGASGAIGRIILAGTYRQKEIALGFETTRGGTRGNRSPRGALLNWANRMTIKRIRKNSSSEMLVLTTVGRKTGEVRETPLRWFPGGDGSWLIVASANGATRNPGWYYNLAAQPDVTVDVQGRKVEVTATQLAGSERDQAWRHITAAADRFAGYQKKPDRELPILRLTPRAAGR
jgi:deazaflavin-dependent oxidoreductase (nitroreductase family)